jgi:protein phosphatase
VALLVVVVLGGGAYAAYAWSQSQYFVGADNGTVAIFQGVSQDVGPIRLSHVKTDTDIAVDDLPDFYRQQVEQTISVDTLADAQARVEVLRTEAQQCAVRKASGGSCATTSTPTDTATTTTGIPSTTTTPTTAPTTSTAP